MIRDFDRMVSADIWRVMLVLAFAVVTVGADELLPSPAERTAGPPAAAEPATPFKVTLGDAGGFSLRVKKHRYAFQTRVSRVGGGFNVLAAPGDDGAHEPNWRCRWSQEDFYAVGDCYLIHRRIDVRATHVQVHDTYTNTTDTDLGLLIYNELIFNADRATTSRLSGFEAKGRRDNLPQPDLSPSVFVADEVTGMGIVPIDDVYVVHAVPYVLEHASGIATERLALAPGDSYTLEWAAYPTATGDYYDFINAFRRAEGRIGTVDLTPGFISWAPCDRRQVPTDEFIRMRNIQLGVIHSLSCASDDPGLSIEGIELADFPEEMSMLRKQAAEAHARHPGFKLLVHVATSLYATNDANRFIDSRMIGPAGRQIYLPPGAYFSQERRDEGWKSWIFYPTPGNSYHSAFLRSVDMFIDDLGMNGVFLTGTLVGYNGQWTYDGRWDGRSAEIDAASGRIARRIGSLALLTQPSVLAFIRKVRAKGGLVMAAHAIFTRTMASEPGVLFTHDGEAGPQLHLAPTLMSLGKRPFKSERDIYLDMLAKLRWGALYIYHNERMALTYPSLASRQYPMTFEEIRPGMVKGPERIVTMNSGVYGWAGDRRLHRVFRFASNGVPADCDGLTTVDAAGCRTMLEIAENESAVIEPLPVKVSCRAPVNVRVAQCDEQTLDLLVNGQGFVTIEWRGKSISAELNGPRRLKLENLK